MNKVEVTSISTSYYYEASNAKVYIGDHLCGTLPAINESSKKYTLNCNVAGDYMKVVTGRNNID